MTDSLGVVEQQKKNGGWRVAVGVERQQRGLAVVVVVVAGGRAGRLQRAAVGADGVLLRALCGDPRARAAARVPRGAAVVVRAQDRALHPPRAHPRARARHDHLPRRLPHHVLPDADLRRDGPRQPPRIHLLQHLQPPLLFLDRFVLFSPPLTNPICVLHTNEPTLTN